VIERLQEPHGLRDEGWPVAIQMRYKKPVTRADRYVVFLEDNKMVIWDREERILTTWRLEGLE